MSKQTMEKEQTLEEIRDVMEGYRRTLNSTSFAFYADTYGHKQAVLEEAQRTLSRIEIALER